MSVDRSRWQKSWPKRLSDIPPEGLPARLRRSVRTSLGEYPAGYRGRVTTSRNGWHLLYWKGEACPHCKVRPSVSRLSPSDLELVDSEGRPLP